MTAARRVGRTAAAMVVEVFIRPLKRILAILTNE
jgi:hypothetical protein